MTAIFMGSLISGRIGFSAMSGIVTTVSAGPAHGVDKPNQESIELIAGRGIAGDAHSGEKIKHRARVKRDATQPNLRQVHLIDASLHEQLRDEGFAVEAGQMGENVTVRGIEQLIWLPARTRLAIGDRAVVELTGLRNPCAQLDQIHRGLMKAVLGRDEQGDLVYRCGVMAIVLAGGPVRPGDRVRVQSPPEPHVALRPI